MRSILSIRGWMQYYGAFYKTELYPLLHRINAYLVRWMRKKYRRLKTFAKAHEAWKRITLPVPRAFRALASGSTVSGEKDEKSPVTRECHAGILREPGGEIPPGHPTSILRQGPSVTDKFEFIDAEYAIYRNRTSSTCRRS